VRAKVQELSEVFVIQTFNAFFLKTHTSKSALKPRSCEFQAWILLQISPLNAAIILQNSSFHLGKKCLPKHTYQQRWSWKHNLGVSSQSLNWRGCKQDDTTANIPIHFSQENHATQQSVRLQDFGKAKYFYFFPASCFARTCLQVFYTPQFSASEELVGISAGNKTWTPTCKQGVCTVKIMGWKNSLVAGSAA